MFEVRLSLITFTFVSSVISRALAHSARPWYQSHVYDNCDECEELLCFSLQLTWHKIFHYKLIATILWFSHSIVTDAQNVFNTGPNYFAINSQFLKLFMMHVSHTLPFISVCQENTAYKICLSKLHSFVKLILTFCLFYYPCIIFCPDNGPQWQEHRNTLFCPFSVLLRHKNESEYFLCWKSAKTRFSR